MAHRHAQRPLVPVKKEAKLTDGARALAAFNSTVAKRKQAALADMKARKGNGP